MAEKGNFGKEDFWHGVAEDSCRKLSRMYEDMPYQSPLSLLYLDPKKEKNNFGRILSKKGALKPFSPLFPPVFFHIFCQIKTLPCIRVYGQSTHSDKNTLSPRTQSPDGYFKTLVGHG